MKITTELLIVIGSVIALVTLLNYAAAVFHKKAPAQSSATWLMWTLLDVILAFTSWKSGRSPLLPIGWTIGAGIVTVAMFREGKWLWSGKETFSAILVVFALVAWKMIGHEAGLIATISAMTLAGLPLLIETVRMPQRATFPLWGLTVVACSLIILGCKDQSFQTQIQPYMSLGWNGLLAIIVLVGKRIPGTLKVSVS